jgi:NAD(P)-dependent dehydrogenase (short-subunit alcohol dehydrogenase family)
MGTLEGKAALITGAGQGVGQGIAFALAKQGVQIAVVGRTESKLKDTVAQIEAFGGRAIAVTADVHDKAKIEESVAATIKAFGRLDILVNNATTAKHGPLLSVTDDDLMSAMSGSVVATLRYMQACHSYLKAAGDGVVINLSTGAPRRWDSSNFGLYAASKRAVEALSRAAASEWGPDNIRVLVIAPVALSPGVENFGKNHPDEHEQLLTAIPLGRIGDCEHDIGEAVVAMVGPAFRYITGAIIPIDGGHVFFG